MTRQWSEVEQRGSRPCARMISHGVPAHACMHQLAQMPRRASHLHSHAHFSPPRMSQRSTFQQLSDLAAAQQSCAGQCKGTAQGALPACISGMLLALSKVSARGPQGSPARVQSSCICKRCGAAIASERRCMLWSGAFLSPDGQKALIAGGVTAYGCKHFKMERDPRDYGTFPCPDVFELDLNSMCWVQACDLPASSINFHASSQRCPVL